MLRNARFARLVYVAVLFALLAGCKEEKGDETAAPSETELMKTERPLQEESMNLDDRWTSITGWKKADNVFPARALDPMLLYSDEQTKQAIYVQEGSIVYESPGTADRNREAPRRLIALSGDEAYYWSNGSTLLIGEDVQGSGRWHSITVHADGAAAAGLKDVWVNPMYASVTLSDKLPLFFLADQENGGRREYLVRPDEPELYSVNADDKWWTNEPSEDSGSDELSAASVPAVRMGRFERETLYPFQDGSRLYAFEDRRGTIVYYFNDNWNLVWRYDGLYPDDFALLTDLLGDSYPLGLFDSGDGMRMMSLPNYSMQSRLPEVPELLDEEWVMVDWFSFYRIREDRIDTIRLDREYDGLPSAHRTSYATNGAQYESNDRGRLAYRTSKGVRYVSVYDLLHADNGTDMSSLWQQHEDSLELLAAAPPAEAAEQKWALPQQMIDQLYAASQLSEEAEQALDDASGLECFSSCYDAWEELQIRAIEGSWYVLKGSELYRLGEGKPKLVKELPLSTSSAIGEGFDFYVAQDYLKSGDDWYFTDTYGDRVVRLDGTTFAVAAEAKLQMPYAIRLLKNGDLQVDSLNGRTILDNNLKRLSQTSVPQVQLTRTSELSEYAYSENEYYEDRTTGRRWGYVLNGKVVLYDPARQSYRSLFVGSSINARAAIHIVPYKNDVLVVLDTKLYRFNAEGRLLSAIEYPRMNPDGIYDTTPYGEGSYVLDEKNGKLYLVQGYRILRIDPQTGKAEPLFTQLYSDIGNIVLNQGKLLFSVEGNPGASANDRDRGAGTNELVTLDIATMQWSRSRLDSNWHSDSLMDKDGSSMLLLAASGNGGSVYRQLRVQEALGR